MPFLKSPFSNRWVDVLDLTLVWLVQALALLVVLLAVSATIAYWMYGSLRAARSVLAGQPIFVVPAQLDLGSVQADTEIPLTVTLYNETAAPISVLGVNDCCHCSLVSDAPVSVPAHGQRVLELLYAAYGVVGKAFHYSIPVITSSNENQAFVEIKGVVCAAPSPHLAETDVHKTQASE